MNGDSGYSFGYGPSTGYGLPGAPVSQGPPDIQSQYAVAVCARDAALRAYLKAMKSGKEYTAEGMQLKRYDLTALRNEYIFWRDMVNNIQQNGTTSTMIWKHVIPYF